MADRTTKVTILAETANYIAGMQKDQAATRAMSVDSIARLNAQSQAFTSTGRAAMAFGTATGLAVVAAVKSFADYSAKMAQVRTLAHASTADMQKLSDATTKYAQQYGISASQAADAEIELVKGGASVADITGGALTGALTLASAAQMSVADATTIAVSAMTEFGLKGQDVTHIADLLAAGADKALGSAQDLGEGLKFVGPVAHNVGISIEETVGALALFAQNGITGTMAGEELRGLLISLTSPSTQAKKEMAALGISVYDSQGHFIGLAAVAQQLHDKLGKLPEAQRNAAMGYIFSNQQITEANILMNAGAKTVDDWTAKVNDSGFAAGQAAGKLDNLKGDATKLGATLKNDLITSGSAANDVLRNLTQGAQHLADEFGALPKPVQEAALGLGAAAAATGLLGGAALIAVPKIAAMDAALAAAGITANGRLLGGLKNVAAFLKSPLTLGLTAATLAVEVFAGQMDAAKASTKDLGTALESLPNGTNGLSNLETQSARGTLFGAFGVGNNESIQQDIDALKSFKSELGGVFEIAGNIPVFHDLWKEINPPVALEDSYKRLGDALGQLAESDLPAAQKSFRALVSETDGSSESIGALLNLMPGFRGVLDDQLVSMGAAVTSANEYALALGDLGAVLASIPKDTQASITIKGVPVAIAQAQQLAEAWNKAAASIGVSLTAPGRAQGDNSGQLAAAANALTVHPLSYYLGADGNLVNPGGTGSGKSPASAGGSTGSKSKADTSALSNQLQYRLTYQYGSKPAGSDIPGIISQLASSIDVTKASQRAMVEKDQSTYTKADAAAKKYQATLDKANQKYSDAKNTLDGLASSLTVVKGKVKDVGGELASFVASVKSDFTNPYTLQAAVTPTGSSVTQSGGVSLLAPTTPTARSVASYFQAATAESTAFADAVKKLRGEKLNEALLEQLVALGPQNGLKVAQALLNGTMGDIASINKSWTSIQTAGGNIGSLLGGDLYSTSLAAAQKQYDQDVKAAAAAQTAASKAQAALDKQNRTLDSLAVNMAKQLGHVLGIKGYAEGTPHGVVEGPGTGKSDSILARISRGEFIEPAEATSANLEVLEYIRRGGVIDPTILRGIHAYVAGTPATDWLRRGQYVRGDSRPVVNVAPAPVQVRSAGDTWHIQSQADPAALAMEIRRRQRMVEA